MKFEPAQTIGFGFRLLLLAGLPGLALTPASNAALAAQPPPDASKRHGVVEEKAVPKEATRRVLGSPTAFSPSAERAHELHPGDRLLMAPRLSADTVLRVPVHHAEGLSAAVVEERMTEVGVWLRLRFAGVVGWLPPSGTVSSLNEGARDRSDREGWWVRRNELVKQAKAAIAEEMVEEEWHWRLPVLGGGTAARTIRVWSERGGHQGKQLRRLTECLPKLYAKRFGAMQWPQDLPVELVVFARRASFERFVANSISIDGMETAGFEVDGLVILTMDSDLGVDSVGTAAHEITHALNRLAFADPPPLWLEEGMAEDMAHSVETAYLEGVGLCRRPGGWSTTQVKETVGLEDGHARKIIHLTRSARARSLLCYAVPPSFGELLELDQLQFANSPNRRWLYVGALLMVRSLLQETEGRGGLLQFLEVGDARERVSDLLRGLEWRATERELLDC